MEPTRGRNWISAQNFAKLLGTSCRIRLKGERAVEGCLGHARSEFVGRIDAVGGSALSAFKRSLTCSGKFTTHRSARTRPRPNKR